VGATPWRFKSSHPHSQIRRIPGLISGLIVLSLALAGPAQAQDPRPLPHPSAPKGKKITWVPYTWERRLGNGWLLRCHVPVPGGKRHCEIIAILG
jgi:hypothetical protein